MPDERDDFELLNDYLEKLQDDTEEIPMPEELLERRPELKSMLKYLDILHGFAAESDQEPPADDDLVDPDDSFVGQQFGEYHLEAELGRGGMGIVYRARHSTLDRTVALKMVLDGHLESTEHRRRFQAEAKAAARFRHPNIVHIHEVSELLGRHYFTMDYIEGENLADRIARGPVPADEAVRIIAAVARAIGHLHDQGVIHRDIKPSNILLDADGTPFVTDFGLAKVFEGDGIKTATGIIAGTPRYMSPEQALAQNDRIGPGSDIYSLGTIFYELLTGMPAFDDETPVEILMQVVSREPPLPRTINRRIPRSLQQICLKCMSKEPEDRYESAEALANDLDHYTRGEPLDTPGPGVRRRLVRWCRRQPALATRLAGFTVFYVVAWFNVSMATVNRAFHVQISLILLAWALASVLCQQLLNSRRWSIPGQFLWGTLDMIFLFAVLREANGLVSPLMVVYFVLIATSGLWLRERFVWFISAGSLLSYGLLLLDFHFWRHDIL
ncbi:MAG: serine/threonine-protein kinase, partial [Planctomycetia bacterium]